MDTSLGRFSKHVQLGEDLKEDPTMSQVICEHLGILPEVLEEKSEPLCASCCPHNPTPEQVEDNERMDGVSM